MATLSCVGSSRSDWNTGESASTTTANIGCKENYLQFTLTKMDQAVKQKSQDPTAHCQILTSDLFNRMLASISGEVGRSIKEKKEERAN